MTKTVILMRHARAEDARIGMRDFDRHLTEDGCAMTEKVAAHLQALGITLDRIIASSAARTKETAEIIAAGVGSSGPLIVRDKLYNATADSFASAVGQECDDDETSVLVVGHNPGIGGLICHWAEESLFVPPATLAIFEVAADQHWNAVRLHTQPVPQLVGLIQDGAIVRQLKAP
jgi:phosphohistidine phosphatase